MSSLKRLFKLLREKNRNYYEEFYNHYLIFKSHLENNSGLLLLKDRLYLDFT